MATKETFSQRSDNQHRLQLGSENGRQFEKPVDARRQKYAVLPSPDELEGILPDRNKQHHQRGHQRRRRRGLRDGDRLGRTGLEGRRRRPGRSGPYGGQTGGGHGGRGHSSVHLRPQEGRCRADAGQAFPHQLRQGCDEGGGREVRPDHQHRFGHARDRWPPAAAGQGRHHGDAGPIDRGDARLRHAPAVASSPYRRLSDRRNPRDAGDAGLLRRQHHRLVPKFLRKYLSN